MYANQIRRDDGSITYGPMTDGEALVWADSGPESPRHTCRDRKPGPCAPCERSAALLLSRDRLDADPAGDALYRADGHPIVCAHGEVTDADALRALTVAARADFDAHTLRVAGDAADILAETPIPTGRAADPAARWDGSRDAARAALRAALTAARDAGDPAVSGALRALSDRVAGDALPVKAQRRHSTRDRAGSVPTGAHRAYLRGALPAHVVRSVTDRVREAYAVTVPREVPADREVWGGRVRTVSGTVTAAPCRPDAPDGSGAWRPIERPDPMTWAGPVAHTLPDGSARVYAVVQVVEGRGDDRVETVAYVPIPTLDPAGALSREGWAYATGWRPDASTREGDALQALREGPGPVRKPSPRKRPRSGRIGTSAIIGGLRSGR